MKISRLTTRVLFAVAFLGLTAAGEGGPLAAFEGRASVLLFFVPDPSSPNLADQVTRLQPYGSTFERQHIVPVAVIGTDSATRLDTGEPLPPGSADALRQHFDVDPVAAYAGYLIGEDGSVLWADNTPVAMSEIITVLGDR